jgi:pyruvate,water dikinase
LSKIQRNWIKNADAVGGKNASLDEMYNNLGKLGVKIPNGFAITTRGSDKFMKYNNLSEKISALLENIIDGDLVSLSRTLIQNGELSDDMKTEISQHYTKSI